MGGRRAVVVRAAVTGALLAVVAGQIDWREARAVLAGGEWRWFAYAVMSLAVALGIGALRWWLMLRELGYAASPRDAARAYWIGTFTNIALPTSFGGDAARAWLISRGRNRLRIAFASVVADRATALACLLLLALGAGAVGGVPARLLGGVALVAAVAVVAAPVAIRLGRSASAARRLPPLVRGFGAEVRDFLALARRPVVAGWLTGLGLAYQAAVVTSLVTIARVVDVPLSWPLAAVTTALVLVMTLIPFSIGGFGIREGGFVLVLGAAGIDPTEAGVLSLLSVAALAVASLPGALLLVLPGTRTQWRAGAELRP